MEKLDRSSSDLCKSCFCMTLRRKRMDECAHAIAEPLIRKLFIVEMKSKFDVSECFEILSSIHYQFFNWNVVFKTNFLKYYKKNIKFCNQKSKMKKIWLLLDFFLRLKVYKLVSSNDLLSGFAKTIPHNFICHNKLWRKILMPSILNHFTDFFNVMQMKNNICI